MRIRLRVKEVAERQKISMGKLSRASDVSYNTIKRIYTDPYRSTTTDILARLAEALGVTPDDLITWEEEKNNK